MANNAYKHGNQTGTLCPQEMQRLLRVAVAAHWLTEEAEQEIAEAFESVEHWLDSFVRLHERALVQR
jgi:tellurite resistance protein